MRPLAARLFFASAALVTVLSLPRTADATIEVPPRCQGRGQLCMTHIYRECSNGRCLVVEDYYYYTT